MPAEALSAPADTARQSILTAERQGYRLLLMARSAVLSLALVWAMYGLWFTGNPTGPLLVAASLALGLAELRTLGTRLERVWRRHAVVALDIGGVVAVATLVPLLAGEDVPQHLVFRAYGLHALWLILMLTVLTLQPGLTLFAGGAAALAVGAIHLGVTADMAVVRSWGDLPRDATAADYVALLLDPAFVGTGNRIEEAAALLAGGAVLALAVARARRLVLTLAATEDRRHRLERAFGQHVPDWVVRRIMAAPDTMAPTVHDATVLHLDVENFTGFAAGRDPDAVLRALDGYLAQASAAVAAEGGIVVSYGGDSMLAVFGGPGAPPGHADAALRAAVRLVAALDRPPLRLRVGLATGPVAAGIVGGAARRAYTVYGETVNRAQRLEQACKAAGVRLLVSAETRAALDKGADDLTAVDLPGRAAAFVPRAGVVGGERLELPTSSV